MLNTTEEVQLAFEKANRDASKLKHEYLTLEHLTFAIMCVEEFGVTLTELGIDYESLKNRLENHLLNECDDIVIEGKIKAKKTRAVERVMQRSFAQALFSNRDKVSLADFILSLLHEKNCLATYYCIQAGVTKDKMAEFLYSEFMFEEGLAAGGGKHANPLERYTDNLTEMAANGEIDPVIGRAEEIESIALSLSRRSKNNVMLVGDPGVGKTAIAEGLAYRIVNKEVPKFLEDYEVFSLKITTLLAGTRYRGEFEERMDALLEDLIQHEKAILYIDEAHMMNGAGAGQSENPNDLANILKPALSKGTIKVIGSTTWDEFRKHFEKDTALMRRFQRVSVEEPSEKDTVAILAGIKKYYEKYHKIKIHKNALTRSVELSVKYQHDKKLPDKAIDLIDQACARFNLLDGFEGKRVVKASEIEVEMAKVLKMPVENIRERETTSLANLESNIKSYVYGQDVAIEQVVDKILVAQAGLKDRNKPIGSFVFMGPTGTGKTETAKQIADNLGVELVRFDMSEYQESHSVSKLLGSPPGYVGYGDSSGKLINKLQEHPNCVLLLDEIEKAHPDISQILLQVMDYGKISGGNGKEIDVSNCVLILTTNLGAADSEKNTIGFGDAAQKVYKDAAFKKFFSPEFRNRLDKVVTFNYLEESVIGKIVDKFISDLRVTLKGKGVTVKLDKTAKAYLMKHGYHREMGARPLGRVIDEKIKTPLSKAILFGELKDGGTVTISAAKNITLSYESNQNVT